MKDYDDIAIAVTSSWLIISLAVMFIGTIIGNSIVAAVGGVAVFSSFLVIAITWDILKKINKKESGR